MHFQFTDRLPPRIRPLSIAMFATLLALHGCGGDGDSEECGVGESCACTTNFDCPNPAVERCQSPGFGQPGVCVPLSGGDTGGTDADASDTGTDDTDPTDTGIPDTGTEVTPDVDADTADTDTLDADTTDADTSDADADTDDTDDTETVDTDTADTDASETDTTEPDRTNYDGWVAYQFLQTGLGQVALVPGDASQEPHMFAPDDGLSLSGFPAFSADGKRLAYSRSGLDGRSIRVVDLETGDITDLFTSGYRGLRGPRLSPDGTQLSFQGTATGTTGQPWNIYVHTFESGSTVQLTTITDSESETRSIGPAVWSHDGERLFYVDGSPGPVGPSSVWSMTPTGTDPVQVTTGFVVTIFSVSVRPDGTELMFNTVSDGSFRLGLSDSGDVPVGETRAVGIPGADGNCTYYGYSDLMLCERLQTPEFEVCTVGGAGCLFDIVAANISTGLTVRNITQTPEASETAPAVTIQPYTELTVDLD